MQQALSFVERLESKEVVDRTHNQQEEKAHLQNFVQPKRLDSSGLDELLGARTPELSR
jgi:hypothetical protein